MANYESTKLIVQMKALARTENMPLDSSEVWDSLSEAQTYIKQANAYAGQTIKAKLEDGKYHTYTLQPVQVMQNNMLLLELVLVLVKNKVLFTLTIMWAISGTVLIG